jgi:hypothetical protein
MAGVYAFHQRKKADQATELMNPFGKQNPTLPFFVLNSWELLITPLYKCSIMGPK